MNINAFSVRRFAVASSLVILGITGWSAATASGLETSSMHVQLSDLDLTTPDGRQVAYGRLHEAARKVCSRVSDQEDLGHQANFLKCVDRLMPKDDLALEQLVARSGTVQVAKSPSR
jgi:UrcA family protein